MARTRAYRNAVLIDENFPVEQVSDYLEDPACLVWVDLCSPGQADLDALGEELQLHSLALEDATKARQRPKLDRYETHLFVTSYEARLDVPTGRLATFEVDAFVTRQALVTVRKTEDFDIEAVVRHWDESPDTSKPSRPSTTRSRISRTCSSTSARTMARSSAARSSCARAWCCCAGRCCRCARWSTA
jgi:magnesium transporter